MLSIAANTDTLTSVMEVNKRVAKSPLPSFEKVLEYTQKEGIATDDKLVKMLKDLQFSQGKAHSHDAICFTDP